MTDHGPEHRPPDAPPPPPPPPDLAPPPGYTAYSQNLSSSVDLRRVKGVATAIVILLAIFAVGSVIAAVGTPRVVDSAKDFIDGTISEDDFTSDVGVYGLMSALSGASQLAIAVLSVIWLFRMVKNHRTIGRQTTWGPGWAIGGWFLPPYLYIIPTLVLRETWKAADPDVPAGDDRWRQGKDNAVLWVWFLVYSVGMTVLAIAGATQQFRAFGGDTRDIADGYADAQTVMIAANVVGIISAGLWALVVRQWTDRHIRLTGEARA
jgi:hypothetical protein